MNLSLRRLTPLLTPLVACIAVAVTLSLWWHEREQEQARLHATFDNTVRQTALRIEQRMASYEQMLRGLQGLFVADAGRVDRATFDAYVDTVMEGPDALGLERLGFSPWVPAAALPAHVAAQRASGLPAYDITPPGAREGYAPIAYLAPWTESNRALLGRDVMTDAARRDTLVQARDSGNLALSQRLTLLQDTSRSPSAGFLMILPVYQGGAAPPDVAGRRARLVGWVSESFRIPDMMSSLYGENAPGLEVRLHDGTNTGNATLMYRSGGGGREAPASSADARLALPQFDAQEYIAFAGHTWTLRVRAMPEFVQRHARDTSDVILVAGGVLSLLLALVTRQLVTQGRRANDVAQAMTRELRASEVRYRRIVETASEGIWVVDARHRIAFANPQIARWLEVDEHEMAGRPLDDFMDAGEAARCKAAFARSPGERRETLEIALRRRDGSATWAALSFRPVAEGDGREGGVLCMLTDISARRAAEERRAALEGQLRESQKMEAIGTLAGGIAHDFNNILAAILGNVATARHESASGAPVEPALAQIQRAAARARSLVQQILTFSRMQAQRLEGLPVQALQPVVEEALQLLRATLPSSVLLDVRMPIEPVWLRADPTQLQQVVMNLCTNAWHALPRGAGRIEVGIDVATPAEMARASGAGTQVIVPEAATAHLVEAGAPASLPEPTAWAHLWVEDTGHGMDAATQSRVFEPFFTTKGVGQGTGLGLAVVHGIVTGHGGRIALRSAPGTGSRFDLWFPLAPAPVAPPAGEAAPAGERTAPRGRGERVACVDDDPAMLLMVQALLERSGYRVVPFERPGEALAALRDSPGDFDVLVTDHTMPGMTGLELARAVAHEAPKLPIVITSGYIPDELRDAAKAAGVRAVLQKEYTLERLAGLVSEVLEK